MIFYFNFISTITSIKEIIKNQFNRIWIYFDNLPFKFKIRSVILLQIKKSFLYFCNLKSKIKLYFLHPKYSMSKQKKVRQIVLDKLYYKNQPILKKSTRSNAPTQSTPNEPKNSFKFIEKFFQNFQTEVAIIYEKTDLKVIKSVKRSLQQQLTHLQKRDKNFKFKTEYDLSSKDLQFRNNILQSQINNRDRKDEKKFLKKKLTGYSRVHTQTGYSRSRDRNKQSTYAMQQKNIKSKQYISNIISPENSRILTKQNSVQMLSKTKSPSLKVEKPKQSRQKQVSLQKEYDKQKYTSCNKRCNNESIIKTNEFNYKKSEEYNNQKYCAPKKNLQRQKQTNMIGQQRIKRIQSLRNLNQNGIRKYYYRREY